mmetsp:Transcript_937/g.938  ORF Transcript_937/g.938 Transcript_937/m.938 type:complete len:138 (-) Transcript_937:370-783(-)
MSDKEVPGIGMRKISPKSSFQNPLIIPENKRKIISKNTILSPGFKTQKSLFAQLEKTSVSSESVSNERTPAIERSIHKKYFQKKATDIGLETIDVKSPPREMTAQLIKSTCKSQAQKAKCKPTVKVVQKVSKNLNSL